MPKLLRYVALAIAIIATFLWVQHENDADACRKAGGRWDAGAETCVPAAPPAGTTPA